MSRFAHTLFVCVNAGKAGENKVRCAQRGSVALLERLKACVAEAGQKSQVRVMSSGCLGLCSKGCAVLALRRDDASEDGLREHWYTKLTAAEAEAFFAAHVQQNGTYVATSEAAGADAP